MAGPGRGMGGGRPVCRCGGWRRAGDGRSPNAGRGPCPPLPPVPLSFIGAVGCGGSAPGLGFGEYVGFFYANGTPCSPPPSAPLASPPPPGFIFVTGFNGGTHTGPGSEWHTGAVARGLFLARFVWKCALPSPSPHIYLRGGGEGEVKRGGGPAVLWGWRGRGDTGRARCLCVCRPPPPPQREAAKLLISFTAKFGAERAIPRGGRE